MDFNATIDLIIRDLEEAREIIDDLKKYPGVPVLQVELAKSKCKTAGEVIALLKTIKNNVIAEEKTVHVNQEPVRQEVIIKKDPENPKPEARIASGKPTATEGSPKPENDSQKSLIRTEEHDQHAKKHSDSAIIADTFSHLSGSLNEQLGTRKADDDISDILKTKPLTSLMEAIGVNDRFLFIREIFHNNRDAYSQALSRLDNTASINDARAIIMSYTGDNNENEAVKQLLDLVKRKLPSNE
jgi:hypothetical protein